jgi:type IV pilus assembly protein PilE
VVEAMKLERGFTLVEVMITVAIVGILTSIALPNYSDYVQRSKITEAVTSLSDMRTRLEQSFLDNRAYPAACVVPAGMKYFVVTCVLPPAVVVDTYTVTATGRATEGMGGFAYTINERNMKASTGPAGTYTNANCWATRENGDC